MRLLVVPASVLAVVAILFTVPASAADAAGIGAGPGGGPAQSFIVVLRDSVGAASTVAAEHASRFCADVEAVYENALKGYAASIPQGALGAVAADARVASVEPDAEVHTLTTQSNATWGIDRIDQRALPLSSTFTYQRTGAGVKAYIIDTGIRTAHTQFGGRAIDGRDTVDGALPAADCNGHGTHVAGTVGGTTYGVAKKVSLVAVRVLNCSGSGTTSGVIAGINWVTSKHTTGKAVANMSLGGSASSSLDTAVNNSINDGIVYAVAAGNSNANACNYSPARVANAITVGATTSSDARASYSNKGSCLDLFGPGSSITSAWNTSNSATNTISGTSMATPHVTGVAALYLQGHSASPTQVRNAIVGAATQNVVTSAGTGSPNLLLYSLIP